MAALPHPSLGQLQRSQTTAPEVTQVSLEAGRSLYQSRCGTCHNLYAPARYATAQWPVLVQRMQDRAHLSAEQVELITRYVQATSEP